MMSLDKNTSPQVDEDGCFLYLKFIKDAKGGIFNIILKRVDA